jgi:membrane-associated protease RseP (regulator of RpoE activity)
MARIGEPLPMSILRGDEEIDLELVPEKSPVLMKEAKLKYFDEIGLTLREYILGDALQRREDHQQLRGVIANFIRPNSPAAAGNVQPGDWIQEIGGQPVGTYEEAVERMEAVVADGSLDEIVVLVQRNNDTAVLRIRKN